MVGAKQQEASNWAVAKFAGRFFIDSPDIGLLWRSVEWFVVSDGLT
jgi:hypothetical protein